MDNRLVGNLAEAEFLVEAMKQKIKLSKPFDGFCIYDFIADSDGILNKIQVKSCSKIHGGYQVELRRKRVKNSPTYNKKDIDIFAIHLTDENYNRWYFIPVNRVPKCGILHLFPDGNSKYEGYVDNWEVFK